MPLIARLVLVILFSAMAIQSKPDDQKKWTLADFKWKYRLIIIQCPDEKTAETLEIKLLKEAVGIKERDILYFIPGEKIKTNFPKPLSSPGQWLERQFALKGKEFTVYLVGKDGGIKLAKNDRLDIAEIFETIDQMPMRIQEMEMQRK